MDGFHWGMAQGGVWAVGFRVSTLNTCKYRMGKVGICLACLSFFSFFKVSVYGGEERRVVAPL